MPTFKPNISEKGESIDCCVVDSHSPVSLKLRDLWMGIFRTIINGSLYGALENGWSATRTTELPVGISGDVAM
tara:strand:- start:1107 stop:1325 length:219 start_codon:yes stop_codon:yes gene_type:complete